MLGMRWLFCFGCYGSNGNKKRNDLLRRSIHGPGPDSGRLIKRNEVSQGCPRGVGGREVGAAPDATASRANKLGWRSLPIVVVREGDGIDQPGGVLVGTALPGVPQGIRNKL